LRVQKLTILFGVLLVAVGLAGYVETGSEHPTALIPCWIGIVLGVAGFLAIAPARRMLWMHVAVTVGLLGFLGTVKGGYQTFQLAHGMAFEHPIAVVEKGATCLLCLVFVAFCVRSFIEARRTRVLGA
jgi:uncharacterized membrane protein (UPF0136 family)